MRRHNVGVQKKKKKSVRLYKLLLRTNQSDSQIGCCCSYVVSTQQKEKSNREQERRRLMRTFANVAPMNLTNHQWGGGALSLTLFIPSVQNRNKKNKQTNLNFLKAQHHLLAAHFLNILKMKTSCCSSTVRAQNKSTADQNDLKKKIKKKKKLKTEIRAPESWPACLNKQTFLKCLEKWSSQGGRPFSGKLSLSLFFLRAI